MYSYFIQIQFSLLKLGSAPQLWRNATSLQLSAGTSGTCQSRTPMASRTVPSPVSAHTASAVYEHDRGKLFLFQKYAQDALVRRKQHPPQLWNWDALNIWRLNKILTESEAVLPRLTFSQPQITWLFDSEFKLQLFRKSVSKSVFYWILQN